MSLHYSIIIFLTIYRVQAVLSKYHYNSTTCDDFQAYFDISKVVGTWHVVSIIPEKQFPDRDVNCSKMDLSEADWAGLKWLLKKTKAPKDVIIKLDGRGTTIRQRYHTDLPYDVWSKSVEGVNGCFQQIMSLDTSLNDTQKMVTRAMMQLHLVETNDSSGPLLVQMLWGRLISAVIYRRSRGVTQERLKPVFELLSKLRGPQRLPIICKNPLRDLLFF